MCDDQRGANRPYLRQLRIAELFLVNVRNRQDSMDTPPKAIPSTSRALLSSLPTCSPNFGWSGSCCITVCATDGGAVPSAYKSSEHFPQQDPKRTFTYQRLDDIIERYIHHLFHIWFVVLC